MRLLVPDEAVPSVFAIDYGRLWKKGIRGLIFDLDNTLCPWRAPSLGEETAELLKRLLLRGFRVCVLSNGRLRNRDKVAAELTRGGILVIAKAMKPLPFGFRLALKSLGLEAERAAVIGDQLFTDIFGGNLIGAYTILVEPLDTREHPWTRWVMRSLERLFGRRFHLSRGSITSRRLSPRILNPKTVKAMKRPGNTAIHHATRKNS